MNSSLPKHQVVLLGAGHTNAHILRMWKMDAIRDAQLVCVSDYTWATYSGMLPGTLAGLYSPDEMVIDLVRRCAAVGARLVLGRVVGLDRENRRLLFEDRPPLAFDVLSIGIGSRPKFELAECDATIVPIKPMQTFLERFESRLETAMETAPRAEGQTLKIAVVGAGAAGIEIIFNLPPRIKRILGDAPYKLILIDAHDRIGGGLTEGTRRRALGELDRRQVQLCLGQPVRRAANGAVELADGRRIEADVVLWATSAAAPALFADLDLPTDDDGFLLTRKTLQTVAGDPIFVVGDSGTIEGEGLPKAGVYAVREGPILWKNIRRILAGEPLVDYQPQRNFLKLLSTGDGRAILSYRGLAIHAAWCWKLKDSIDRRFMDKHQDYEPMQMNGMSNHEPPAMRCAGCGGKVAGSVLSAVLGRLDVPASEHVLLGLEQPDDAAIYASPSGRPVMVTTDFFAAPLDDPYLVGRVAALNAASDIFALGGTPRAALASVSLPIGGARQQEELLFELLAGSLDEFRQMGATLIGGHTIEAPQTTIGFTVLGDSAGETSRTKAALRAGDLLVLTKPIGTGTLLAGHMQAKCRATWFKPLLDSMLLSNQPAAGLLDRFDIAGATDVTGFGLAGHLLEMLRAADLAATLRLAKIPLLPGTAQLLGEGIESTLAPANKAAEAEIEVSESVRKTPGYQALFDPQTSGGLLLGVPAGRADEVLAVLAQQTDVPAAVIGEVYPAESGKRRLTVAE